LALELKIQSGYYSPQEISNNGSYSDGMKPPDARSLSPEAQQALRQRVVHTMQDQRLRPAQAARLFGLHRTTVGRWWKAFQRDGPDALLSRRRGRRPRPLLPPDQEARLLDVVRTRTPDQLGLPETLWTRAAVADWAAQELGIRRSASTWGRWLYSHGYTPQKAARRAYERDPAAVRRWLEHDYPRLVEQAAAEGAEIHWLDESSLRSDSALGKGYAPRGCTPVRRIPGRRFGVNFLAALTGVGQLRFLVYCGKLSGMLLITFLMRLLAGRRCKVYVILDSHPTHRGRLVTGWARGQQERLRLVYLPGYSPELNPAEYLNNDVKANAQRQGRARDRRSLLKKVRSYLFSIQYRREYVRAYFRAVPVRYAA
jgi:transposase